MIPFQFDYAAPREVGEAVALLQRTANAMPLAGGLSLLPAMTSRCLTPALLVDLGSTAGLQGISTPGGGLRIGAMTTCTAIISSAPVRQQAAALAQAAGSIADPQVRNRSTLGGALAYADPAGDLAPAALVLDARVEVRGPQGTRTLPMDQFIVGPFRTALAPGEIITAAVFPGGNLASAYVKFKNPGSSYGICGVAAAVGRGSDGRVRVCRIAVTGATDHPMRLSLVEAALQGQEMTPEMVAQAAALAADPRLAFRSDFFTTAAYRAHLTAVLVKRALSALLA